MQKSQDSKTMNRRKFSKLAGGSTVTALAMSTGVLSKSAQAAGEKIKIGQIGTGHAHAPGKAETIKKFSDQYEFVGIVEPDPELRQQAQQNDAYKDVPWLSEEELLNTPGLKAVAVETTVRDLVPTAQHCIDAGLHVHLDKPAGESLDAFRTLLNSATKKNLVIQMGYMYRYHPAFQLCQRAVKEGWLGEVFELHAVLSKEVNDQKRKEIGEYAGGSMFELGCHLIDLVVLILGAPQKVTAYTRKTRAPEDTLADNQLAVFEYPKATATVRSTLIEPYGFLRRQFVICGTGGVIDIRPLEPPKIKMALTEPHGGYSKRYQDVELPEVTGRYDADFTDLAKIICGEKTPDFSPEHDLATHKAILEASGVL